MTEQVEEEIRKKIFLLVSPGWRLYVCRCIRTLFQQVKLLRSKKCWCSWSAQASLSDTDSLADCCQPNVHCLRRMKV